MKNNIRELTDSIGTVHSDLEAMGKVANDYFHNMFTADCTLNASHILDLIQNRVSNDDNERLCATFSDKEISDALFQIGALDVPGPDGFLALFFSVIGVF